MLLPKVYDKDKVEGRWSLFWEEKGYFHADENDKSKVPFCIVIPPPNVTGTLHMGHALNNTIQDILIRYKRMQGYNTLWLPGIDHAGIATQNCVERQLKEEGLSREILGRDAFVERVWQWKERYGEIIISQLKELGSSCDWKRLRFTMDTGLSNAVREVFVSLYEEGYIYRGNYIVNWCPRCHTAISDIEVTHQNISGHLYYIKYPIANTTEFIEVATTRPETMLGDTAVAVNPQDMRYCSLVGKMVILPIVKRVIPIIADPFVLQEFGTGVVKVTPAHDPNDFEIFLRHPIEQINILNKDGTMNENAGKYVGMDRFACRKLLIDELEKEGLLSKIEPYEYTIGHCYRCGTIIEPYLSKQWFLKTKELAQDAIDCVKTDRIRFIPENWERVYLEWMENIKDWCISRQLWWGHRIPVWYCLDCNKEMALRENPSKCIYCGGRIIQDEDVLDTWFSSSLWPFSTLGYPEKTEELKQFYPTSVLSTGFDIIFFWVARMIMMGLKFMGDVPFKEVYIHALIRDAEGQKMSKSKGNVIDPLHLMNQYGVDALRFTLAIMTITGRDILLSETKIEGYKHFCNKIWNAARFILMNTEDLNITPDVLPDFSSLTLVDRWIISRLNQVISKVTTAIDTYNFSEAASLLYDFIWHQYCDWYIELAKSGLSNQKTITGSLLVYTFERLMRLLHPFMPFITEEIWQHLPHIGESVEIAPWPQVLPLTETSKIAIEEMSLIQEVVYKVRNIRSEMEVSPQQFINIYIRINDALQQLPKVVILNQDETKANIRLLTKASTVEVDIGIKKPPHSATAVISIGEIYVPLSGIIDFEKERGRLGKEWEKINRTILLLEQKLQNEAFLSRAPSAIVQEVKDERNELIVKKERIEEHLLVLG